MTVKMMRSAQDIVEQAESVVIDMLPKRPSVQALARATGVSVLDLQQAFRTVRGVPLYTALLALRLEAADRMFRAGEALSARAAAIKCGFGHYGVFHRNFRLHFGREPGASPAPAALESAADHPETPQDTSGAAQAVGRSL